MNYFAKTGLKTDSSSHEYSTGSKIKYLEDMFLLEGSKNELKHNIEKGGNNIFAFYQADIGSGKEKYPVSTSILQIQQMKNTSEALHGNMIFVYHDSDIVAEVMRDENYRSNRFYYDKQIEFLKKASKEITGKNVEFINAQNFSKKEGKVLEILKNKYTFEDNTHTWLSWFNYPSIEKLLLSSGLTNTQARRAYNEFYVNPSNDHEKTEKIKKQIGDVHKNIVNQPEFKYNVDEIIIHTVLPHTHGATIRPNIGNSRGIQEIGREFSGKHEIREAYGNDLIYVPIYGMKHLRLPVSFMFPEKTSKKGIRTKFSRINEIKIPEDIIGSTSGDLRKYMQDFDSQFVGWRESLQIAKSLVNKNGNK